MNDSFGKTQVKFHSQSDCLSNLSKQSHIFTDSGYYGYWTLTRHLKSGMQMLPKTGYQVPWHRAIKSCLDSLVGVYVDVTIGTETPLLRKHQQWRPNRLILENFSMFQWPSWASRWTKSETNCWLISKSIPISCIRGCNKVLLSILVHCDTACKWYSIPTHTHALDSTWHDNWRGFFHR